MDNIKKLEKRWYFYKAKQGLLSLNAFAFIGMLSLASYYAYTKVDMIKIFFNEKTFIAKEEIKVPELMVAPVLLAKTVEKPVEKSVKSIEVPEVVLASKNEGFDSSALYEVSLEPVIPIIDMEKESRKTSSKRVHRSSAHTKSSQRKMVKAKASTYLTAKELSSIRKEVTELDTESIKRIDLNGSSKNYIETIQKKFSRSRKPREALLLAKVFYNNRNYLKSEEWALTANKLDSSNDESWHIFAKSKAKLGQKEEALKILSSYYKKSHSPKTKALIIKIQTSRL